MSLKAIQSFGQHVTNGEGGQIMAIFGSLGFVQLLIGKIQRNSLQHIVI